MKIGLIAFTAAGDGLAEKLQARLGAAGLKASRYRCRAGLLHDWTRRHFASDDALVFIGATGIAVRAVAPYLKSKSSDPAVVVIDEQGSFVIALLAGHLGGANRLAEQIAAMLGAVPVITTATECNRVFAIDRWAGENNIRILNPERIKSVSTRLLAGEKIYLQSMFPIEGALPNGLIAGSNQYDVLITVKRGGREEALRLIPPLLTVGVGCRKGVSKEAIQRAFENLLEKGDCHREAVCRFCSIDLKAQEAGLIAFCEERGLPFQTFSAEQLGAVSGRFTSSAFVREITGVDNVCERSAALGSGGELLVKRIIGDGVAMALAIAPYTLHFREGQGMIPDG
ncbi:MAG TPA: cobalt-precorrin 5A hydrolase [Bacillota bacterium]|jgi:cobalt-precorrin 5A hydrolase|nr:cobalt-precorrin 5A hydrolase [Bacillota bacterium]HPZ42136.1 cobalt-precorrin 5A hydrolase [Bacillota bacterium]HQD53024.1 cobalt-precorrin 5A hydrolase [Bacillota bacterium]